MGYLKNFFISISILMKLEELVVHMSTTTSPSFIKIRIKMKFFLLICCPFFVYFLIHLGIFAYSLLHELVHSQKSSENVITAVLFTIMYFLTTILQK